MDGIADVMVRLEHPLTAEALARLREDLRGDDGIICACPVGEQPPVLMVLYNPMRLRFADVLARVEGRGVRARLIPCPEERSLPGLG